MKNKSFILFIVLLLILVSGLIISYHYLMKNDEEHQIMEKDYSFDMENGSINISADKALKCRGTAGSSNNIFYLNNNNLYLYSENGINDLYAFNVDDIYYEDGQVEQITVVTNDNTVIVKESTYLNYLSISKDDTSLIEFNFNIVQGSVGIKANKALQVKTAEGQLEVIYYLKDSNLYHYVIDGEDELYATGVIDMYFANKSGELVSVVLDEKSNILNNSIYLSYVSVALKQFVFDTESGQVIINANKALACRGAAGSSNTIFYMIDGNLYLYSSNKVNTLYAKNIGNIYYESEQSDKINVITNEDTIIIKESSYLNYEKFSDNKKYNEYTFNTTYGVVTINANKALACQGWAGASNTIFFIRDNNLYKLMYEGAHQLYAKNVEDIYFEKVQTDQMTVLINDSTVILKEESYLKYLNNNSSNNEIVDNIDLKEYKFSTAYGDVKINADKALVCQGWAGASNTIFFIRDNNLYKYIYDGEDELYATGIKDMLYANKFDEKITIVLDEGSKIIKEEECLLYVSTALIQYVFNTESGQIIINAHKALACRGTAGASNKIFYMIDGNLYLYSDNSTNDLYAKNIGNIYYESKQSEEIMVTTNKDTVIVKESTYLNYR